ncbi:hypothetical protein HYPSUDRAFT_136399 [Hypholoma sublateritium FD-334 SS-4]|uniref:Uncharacterized protein n=1 Tax=Hypholoma sublateritium (strain FD-334 SS-4) TaxID=945553 RepID=A0A0D2P058_HYPSF|nr:hypothetical protein HYPSUDRAFT_136399 [Hypholoma sublateritium FD-334 SS-4]
MPEELRVTLLSKLHLVYSSLKTVDSEAEGANNSFYSFHFSYYNRFSNRGDGTPANADPTTLMKDGRKKTNTCQNTPRRSNELKDRPEEYLKLQDALKPVFEWLTEQLRALLPETYAALSLFVEVLPCSDVTPIYPFGGFVININVTTRIHRDHGDHDICLVISISDCLGGELCLFEPGIVLDLRSGYSVIFASAAISHFNLHYKGIRASIVLHSDRGGMDWVVDRNGWAHNIFMRTHMSNSNNDDAGM